jgi:hypothetical protein
VNVIVFSPKVESGVSPWEHAKLWGFVPAGVSLGLMGRR